MTCCICRKRFPTRKGGQRKNRLSLKKHQFDKRFSHHLEIFPFKNACGNFSTLPLPTYWKYQWFSSHTQWLLHLPLLNSIRKRAEKWDPFCDGALVPSCLQFMENTLFLKQSSPQNLNLGGFLKNSPVLQNCYCTLTSCQLPEGEKSMWY